LEDLCRAYWPPIYAYVRRHGYSVQDAQDLTQGFFARLLEKRALEAVDPARGRFRSFLLASLRNFLANEWDKSTARKRGGKEPLISFETLAAEPEADLAWTQELTAEKLFDRRWALAVLERVLSAIRAEYDRDGKTCLFEELKPTLTGQAEAAPYGEIAARLAMSEGAIKVAVHRLRHRYRTLLREEIAHTVSSPEMVEEELRSLFAALEG
jgi:RNA polymerase sigma-70 factor (ECF subfamily)